MRYLITGGLGFIGPYLAKRLLNDGHDVTIVDNLTRGREGRLDDVMKDIHIVSGDVRDADVMIEASKGVQGIFHLAAVNGTDNFYKVPELVLDVGIRGMLAVMDAVKANNIPELIVASSAEAYQSAPVVPTDESAPLVVPDPLNARYSYGGSKILSELIAINYGRNLDSRVMVFRPHNVYGADMGWKHVIPEFIMRTLELREKHGGGEPLPFPIQGDGSETRAFCHVDDIVDGLLLLRKSGEDLGIYHIGNSEEVAIKDLADMIAKGLGTELELIPGEMPKGATPRRCPDISKMRKLGFDPRYSLDEGLPAVIDWYRDNADLFTKTKALL